MHLESDGTSFTTHTPPLETPLGPARRRQEAAPRPRSPQVQEAAAAVRQLWPHTPRVGLVLGTGMGNVARYIDKEAVIPYGQIPHFPCSTALGHKGQLVCGQMAGVPVIAMEGRCHIYEGYSLEEVTLAVRVMRALGASLLIASNASGGMNPKFASGDIMLVEDHLNMLGPRAGSMYFREGGGRLVRPGPSPYDEHLIDRALTIARRENFAAHRGVYVAMTGPNYETRAEYRFLKRMGGDVVGMSTVPEAMVASALGMRVLAISTVTNIARPDCPQIVDPHEVIAAAEGAEPKLRKIALGVIAEEA